MRAVSAASGTFSVGAKIFFKHSFDVDQSLQ
jgi:hypothetical protein